MLLGFHQPVTINCDAITYLMFKESTPGGTRILVDTIGYREYRL